MKRITVLFGAAVLVAAFWAAPIATAHGACIGPITKSAIYTYADRVMQVNFGDPVTYSKFKMTGKFCYDSLGNAWGVSPITWQRVSGNAFIALDNPPYYVVTAGGAYAAISYGYFATNGGFGYQMRIGPRLSISGVNGHFNAYDSGALIVTETAHLPLHDFDPVFSSAALQ